MKNQIRIKKMSLIVFCLLALSLMTSCYDDDDDDCDGEILTQNLPVGKIGVDYTYQLEAILCDSDDYFWRLESGSLPPGISLTSGGLLKGKPTLEGLYQMTITLVLEYYDDHDDFWDDWDDYDTDYKTVTKGFSIRITALNT